MMDQIFRSLIIVPIAFDVMQVRGRSFDNQGGARFFSLALTVFFGTSERQIFFSGASNKQTIFFNFFKENVIAQLVNKQFFSGEDGNKQFFSSKFGN